MARRTLIGLLVAAALIAACGSDDTDTSTGAGGAATTERDGTASAADDAGTTDGTGTADGAGGEPGAAPAIFDFVLDDVRGGEPVDGSAYAGTDVIVWFWAPWCTKCNEQADGIAELSSQRDDVRFLGMAGLGDEDASADFVERHGLDGFAHAFDEDGGTWQEFGITTQSSFAFVDDDGSFETVSYTNLGSEELQRRIDDLVAR